MSDAAAELATARKIVSQVIDANMVRGEHVARAKMIEEVLHQLSIDVRDAEPSEELTLRWKTEVSTDG